MFGLSQGQSTWVLLLLMARCRYLRLFLFLLVGLSLWPLLFTLSSAVRINMEKQTIDGIFVLREEDDCPLYSARQEFCAREGQIVLPVSKSACPALADLLLELRSLKSKEQRAGHHIVNSAVYFDCRGSGCEGFACFELRKEREKFLTPQMKMLAAAERRSELTNDSDFSRVISELDIFKVLSESDLAEVKTLFELREYSPHSPIISQGALRPHLSILLSGRVEIVDADGQQLTELGAGDIFGLSALFSGNPVVATIVPLEACRVGEMTQENFYYLLKMFPDLYSPLYKLVANYIALITRKRAQAPALQGQLADMAFPEICQLLYSTKKTGRMEIDGPGLVDAWLSFSEGELVAASYNDLLDRDAFNALLGLDSGRFCFIQGLSAEEKDLKPIDSFMKLLFDGARRLDENSESLSEA
ncbi:related to cAMP-dependent protein kinase [Desulfotalea psychrophila LSv54]|uniref:Related to cAMP-dependent protein kinase n=2 Tax=Desulfotalea psychrophila TaxID=84980 RepID=Q6AKA0_DESPS|nr:related to cAMP-dependent protein kinase [Desulfotalea psychrophila LSv54]